MRTPFVAGNWKMHTTIAEAERLVDALAAQLDAALGVEVAIAPPFTALSSIAKRIRGTSLRLAAQNVHFESQGAFTGEISPAMLKDVGCVYAIVGHSERRTLFGESQEVCGKKVRALLMAGISPILCVGETLAERDAQRTLDVVAAQLMAGLVDVPSERASDVVIAYEPVWAIGTGRNATPSQAAEVHSHIRHLLNARFGDASQRIRIQYGGSVKPENARDLFGERDIDGGLIGGASLKAETFLAICHAAQVARVGSVTS